MPNYKNKMSRGGKWKSASHFALNEASRMKTNEIMILHFERNRVKRAKIFVAPDDCYRCWNPQWLHSSEEAEGIIKSNAYDEERARLFSIWWNRPSLQLPPAWLPTVPDVTHCSLHNHSLSLTTPSQDIARRKVRNYCALMTIIKREQ